MPCHRTFPTEAQLLPGEAVWMGFGELGRNKGERQLVKSISDFPAAELQTDVGDHTPGPCLC